MIDEPVSNRLVDHFIDERVIAATAFPLSWRREQRLPAISQPLPQA